MKLKEKISHELRFRFAFFFLNKERNIYIENEGLILLDWLEATLLTMRN